MYFCQKILHYEDVNEHTHRRLLDYLGREDLPYKLILMPRGHLKTSVVTIGSTLQRYIQDPNKRTLIVNATGKNARAFMRSIQTHITQNKDFVRLYGENEYGKLAYQPDTWNQWEIVLPRSAIYTEPTIKVSGLTATSVSQHYDRIILDDLVNRESISTSDQIAKTIQYYKDYEDLLEPDGEMIVIGTRWHWGDLYGWLMENASEAFNEPLVMQAVKDGDLENGEILFPQKFSRKKLISLKAIKGPYDFSCQYLNMPTAPEDAVFQKRWFRYYKFDQDKVQLLDTKGNVRDTFDKTALNVYISIDPAISEKKDGDFTGLIVVGVDILNRWFILECVRMKLRPSEIIPKALSYADTYHAKAIGVESVAFTKSLVYDFNEAVAERQKRYNIVEIKPETTISKDMRIAGLQPKYARGQMFHTLNMKDGDLETELLHHPRPVHDDLSDALQQILQFAKVPRDFNNDEVPQQPGVDAYRQANPYTGW